MNINAFNDYPFPVNLRGILITEMLRHHQDVDPLTVNLIPIGEIVHYWRNYRPKEYEYILLYFQMGYTVPEIAKIKSLSHITVYAKLHKMIRGMADSYYKLHTNQVIYFCN